jgi:beta-phosphoglucomutase-like phosphatase (HAD superfamily)
MHKLIIWDFDGVIADTEHISMMVWQDALKKYGINWSFEETAKKIMGTGQNKQLSLVNKYNPSITMDDIKNDIQAPANKALQENIKLTDGIEDIFRMGSYAHCIASGGAPEGIETRLSSLGIKGYFPQAHVFSANYVAHGKPEPDLFLYAAKNMGFSPEHCIVVEDSIAGLTAGLRAGMTTVAFTEHAVLDKGEYTNQIKSLGIKHIFDNMSELKQFLENRN